MADTGKIRPVDCLRRSFVYRILEQEGANFTEVDGAAVAFDFGAPEAEATAAHSMAVADLSPLRRFGVKGRGALDWASNQGVATPDFNNTARRQQDGTLAVRLADTELLILDSPDGMSARPQHFESQWPMDATAGAYPVNRQSTNFWFAVTGKHGAELFAKLCAVDLRPSNFPIGAVAQTSVARTNCIIIRGNLGSIAAYHVLGDSASAEYLWGCLTDAMAEFGGRLIGLDVLRTPGSVSTSA